MPRSRIVRPEFLERPGRARLSRDAQLLYVLMQVIADDYGCLLDSPKAIAGSTFPLDDSATVEVVNEWLDELVTEGWLVRYTNRGARYLMVEDWETIQKPSKRADSSLPSPNDPGSEVSGLSHNSVTTQSQPSSGPVSAFASGSVSGSLGSRRASSLQGNPNSSSPSSRRSSPTGNGKPKPYNVCDEAGAVQAINEETWRRDGLRADPIGIAAAVDAAGTPF